MFKHGTRWLDGVEPEFFSTGTYTFSSSERHLKIILHQGASVSYFRAKLAGLWA